MEKTKVVSSLVYKFIERVAVKGIGLVIGIILARLLSPEYFGLLAILMVFINLSQVIVQSGLNMALVQNKTADDRDCSTVFYLCAAIAILMIGILYISAPYISRYYNTTELVAPLRVMSVSLIFGAFNSVQTARLQRNLQFKQTMVCGLITTVMSGAIGILLAYLGFGLWALVLYTLASSIISCISMAFIIKWFPKLQFSVSRAKEFFSYGWKILVAALFCSLYADLRSLIIGKKFNTTDLGFYSRGQQFPGTLSNTLDGAVQSVMFPVLSKECDNRDGFLSTLRKTVSLGSFIVMPVMFCLAAAAEPFISFLLTDKWLPCVIFMQVICIGEAPLSLTSSCLVSIKASGRSDVFMRLEIIRRICMLAVLLVSVFCFDSVFAIAVGYTISAWFDIIVISFPMRKLMDYGLQKQLSDVWKSLVASLITAVCVGLFALIELAPGFILIIQCIIGTLLYWGLSKLMKNPVVELAGTIVKKFVN